MNKNLLLITTLFASLFLGACTSNSSSAIESQSSSVSLSSENQGISYRVRVFLPTGLPFNDDKTMVQLCSDTTCYQPVKLNNGIANINVNDENSGELIVHLLNLPSEYTYNPYIYTVSPEKKDVVIPLTEYGLLNAGDGTLDNGYVIHEGTYPVNITDPNVGLYYRFAPSKPGIYKIESLAYSTLGIKTSLFYHGANPQMISEVPQSTSTSGGYGDINNVNFAFEIDCVPSSFMTSGEGENIKYETGAIYHLFVKSSVAATFPLSITYVKESEEVVIEKEEKEIVDMYSSKELSKYPDNTSTDILTPIPMDGTANITYDESSDTFKVVDIAGVEVNKNVLIKITKRCEYIGAPLSEITATGTGVTGDQNYFILDGATKNYEPMVKQYAEICNKDGVCQISDELKIMLKLIADKQKYFRVSRTIPGYIYSQLEYKVAEENQWLWACYYYKSL